MDVQGLPQALIRSFYAVYMVFIRLLKLWFEKFSKHLESRGLCRSTTSPCIFIGTLIEGEPPIYVGIYVDDIIYFSPSDQVERVFESKFSTLGNVDFMGQVSHLGN
jgi:hypothetical protein